MLKNCRHYSMDEIIKKIKVGQTAQKGSFKQHFYNFHSKAEHKTLLFIFEIVYKKVIQFKRFML